MGGIGSGCIGLAGNGRLTDWEIFGRPNKGGNNGFSHFAVKAERNGQVIDARVLHGDPLGSLMGSRKPVRFDHYGHGPSRYTMSGFPHFSQVTFEGTFPTATLTFADPEFPGGGRCAPSTPSFL